MHAADCIPNLLRDLHLTRESRSAVMENQQMFKRLRVLEKCPQTLCQETVYHHQQSKHLTMPRKCWHAIFLQNKNDEIIWKTEIRRPFWVELFPPCFVLMFASHNYKKLTINQISVTISQRHLQMARFVWPTDSSVHSHRELRNPATIHICEARRNTF